MYQVIWHSPRGFCNEGNYIYGDEATLKELADVLNVWTDINSEWTEMSRHKTLAKAKEMAEKRMRKDAKIHKNFHEICYCSVVSATHLLAEEKEAKEYLESTEM